jgi:hypothetical protein
MSFRFSLSITDEIGEVMKLALRLTGKSQNAACTQWIMEGALREIALFKEASLLSVTPTLDTQSIPNTLSVSNGERKAEVLSITTEEQMTDTPSITDTPTYQRGDRIRIVKVPKSKRGSNIIDQKGTLISRVNGGKWAIALDNGGNTELPEAYIEKTD